MLVANKTDLPPQRHQVRLDMAQDWATTNTLDFFDVSAVSGVGRRGGGGRAGEGGEV